MTTHRRVPLQRALVILLAAAFTLALVPAGIALDRRIEAELRRVAIEDLARAPMILDDRAAARSEALTMHAMSVAASDGLVDAVRDGDLERATSLARATAGMYGEDPVLITPDGRVVVGPEPSASALAAILQGESTVEYVFRDGMPLAVGVVALGGDTDFAGAAGSAAELGSEMAGVLAGLARAEVTIAGVDGSLVATTIDPGDATTLLAALRQESGGSAVSEEVREITLSNGSSFWVASGGLGGAGSVLFVRSVSEELAALPGLRNSAVLAAILTLILALTVAAGASLVLTRPVRALALAADRVSEGDFDAPVPSSRVEELDRLGRAFGGMRGALEAQLGSLEEANAELAERQERLAILQTELIRQDRLASSARIVAELAHEIRNPVANVRNCLEVVRRGVSEGSEEHRFAEMAIDELLRMHELAEQLLDLNRPFDVSVDSCPVYEVASQVSALVAVGDGDWTVEVHGRDARELRAAIPPDALKQILFNLLENAREAAGPRGKAEIRVSGLPEAVRVDVLDDGPGLPPEVLPNIFDAFFTTKGAVHGVGLGLFVAEGLARRYGGRMQAGNRTDGSGAQFVLEIPASRDGQGSERTGDG